NWALAQLSCGIVLHLGSACLGTLTGGCHTRAGRRSIPHHPGIGQKGSDQKCVLGCSCWGKLRAFSLFGSFDPYPKRGIDPVCSWATTEGGPLQGGVFGGS